MFEAPFVFNVDITVALVIENICVSMLMFVTSTLLSMMLTYIAQIRGGMVKLMAENLNLLDRMHEGLIVISEKDYSLQFASRPAVELLK